MTNGVPGKNQPTDNVVDSIGETNSENNRKCDRVEYSTKRAKGTNDNWWRRKCETATGPCGVVRKESERWEQACAAGGGVSERKW
ncbi:hypothetical protein DPV78_011110 [Talaromyces pinophilus]|nr:hypothetical protein DPV78_011110 [Talaromyces pinophilus]